VNPISRLKVPATFPENPQFESRSNGFAAKITDSLFWLSTKIEFVMFDSSDMALNCAEYLPVFDAITRKEPTIEPARPKSYPSVRSKTPIAAAPVSE
jgi:hypothetical protein